MALRSGLHPLFRDAGCIQDAPNEAQGTPDLVVHCELQNQIVTQVPGPHPNF